MHTLHIHLLGDFLLTYKGRPVDGVSTSRLQALLAYLLLHNHAPQPRYHLAFLFWPDSYEDQALTNLPNLLYKLRQALPAPDTFLAANAHNIQWLSGAPYTLDVADFEAGATQAASKSSLEQAAALYRGDLLPSCYDEWIEPLRERLRLTAMDALERLSGMLEEEREIGPAMGYAHRLLELDRLRESTYRTLLRLYALDGDRAAALRTFQACAALLEEEL